MTKITVTRPSTPTLETVPTVDINDAVLKQLKAKNAEEAVALAVLTGEPLSKFPFKESNGRVFTASLAVDGISGKLSDGFKGSFEELFNAGFDVSAKKIGQMLLNGISSLRQSHPNFKNMIDLKKNPTIAATMKAMQEKGYSVTAETLGYALIAADNLDSNVRSIGTPDPGYDYRMNVSGSGYSASNQIDDKAFRNLKTGLAPKPAIRVENMVVKFTEMQAKYAR